MPTHAAGAPAHYVFPAETTPAEIPLPAHPVTHSIPLPALNGRSVRNLRHVRLVRSAALGAVAVLAVFGVATGASVAVPAYAQAVATPVVQPAELQLQSFTAPMIVADATTTTVSRDAYGVTVPAPLQWPLSADTPISDGFGPRVSPCSGCSSYHEGVDFDAPAGTPVHAVAAGVVVETNNPGWAALGIHVAIQHVIDGQVVTTAYGHMQVGSMTLEVGDVVTVGQVVGTVGSTGASTGNHLHFEVRVGGTTAVDPLAWMHAHLG